MAATVLVTGGFGFIGAHVVRMLLETGCGVVVIDREEAGNSAEEVLSSSQRASIECIVGAIPGPRTLARLMRQHGVENVAHLASPLATVTESRPRLVTDRMVAPHAAILDASRVAGIRRVVWASSVGVFGREDDYQHLPLANDAPHVPQTLYGAGKSFLERFSSQYTRRYGLDTLGLRFPLVYGPGRRRGGGQFTTEMIEAAALGKRCIVQAADQRNDWMYVTDAARSVLLALAGEQTRSRALTVCGQVATTREVATMLAGWFSNGELVLVDGSTGLVADFDPRPAHDQLGYRPLEHLSGGLLSTANAARRRAGLPEVA
jgi:nucleoside-diphosphate-sugar epimerase